MSETEQKHKAAWDETLAALMEHVSKHAALMIMSDITLKRIPHITNDLSHLND